MIWRNNWIGLDYSGLEEVCRQGVMYRQNGVVNLSLKTWIVDTVLPLIVAETPCIDFLKRPISDKAGENRGVGQRTSPIQQINDQYTYQFSSNPWIQYPRVHSSHLIENANLEKYDKDVMRSNVVIQRWTLLALAFRINPLPTEGEGEEDLCFHLTENTF